MTAIALPAARRLDWATSRRLWAGTLLVAAAVLYLAFQNQWVLPHDEDAGFFHSINGARDWVDANRNSSPIFLFFINYIRLGIAGLFDLFRTVLTELTWPGVTAVAGALGLVFASRRVSLLMVGGFLAFGVLGLWEQSIDTLALTLTAVVLSLAIGVPLGIVAGRSDRFERLVTPVLDVMQIMPTFSYLAPMTLFLSIGAPAAAIVTMIYAIPPAIRITSLGIRGVQSAAVEAAVSLGSTRWQVLRKVQLPMAKPAIVLAINQTIMMALAMVVITALINAPGLGEPIIHSLERTDVGTMFDAGLAVVIMAILLDRLTEGASVRLERQQLSGALVSAARRRLLVLSSAGVAAGAILIGRALQQGAEFPSDWHFSFRAPVNAAVAWVEDNAYTVTDAIKNGSSEILLNPLQGLLTSTPFWLVVLVVFGAALLLSGVRAAIVAAACLLAIAGLQIWQHGMETLASVLVATVITLAIGVLFGVLSARSDRFARALRPVLDAAQTMPAFVYLLPAIALFSVSRFSAIMAAVIYAVPPVIRLVDAGIRAVPAAVIEAATSAGSSEWQLLWKVRLPMARRALLLAANQGIVLVLAMVVVGGLVGAGALGYDVVAGFAQREDFGKGLAAGVAIVLLGIMLDRITQGAGGRPASEFRHGG